jgi:hypothetical protein
MIPRLSPALVLLVFVRQRAWAFTGMVPSVQQQPHHSDQQYRIRPLYAVIYGADGKIVKEEENQDNDKTDLPLHVLYGIQAEVDAATLARVACAFAPPEHQNLQLEDVKQAILVAVRSTSLDIALSLVASFEESNQQLLQVLVTVPFSPAPSDNMIEIEQHIMEQIRQLDAKAVKRLDVKGGKPAQASLFVMSELTEEPTMDVMCAVDWWTTVPPLKTFLRDECASFKDLLNTGTDFQRELQMLAQQQLKQSNLQRVQVASIGTSGVWLKAAVLQKDKDEKAAILDVPIQFLDQKEAATADDLRESVLNLVELVENLPLVEPAKEPERAMAANEEPAKPMSKAKKEEPAEPVPVAAKAEPSPAEKETTTKPRVLSKEERVAQARQQPKSPKEEAELAAKYAAIEDLGERAYTILVDLGMI